MAKQLSEQLAALSGYAKNAEDAAVAAQKETRDKVAARRVEARASATAAAEKVNKSIASVGDNATTKWGAAKAKITGDIAGLKAQVTDRKQEFDAKRADKWAEELEGDAAFAIDYAVASIEQARLAVLDAIVGRLEAEAAKTAKSA